MLMGLFAKLTTQLKLAGLAEKKDTAELMDKQVRPQFVGICVSDQDGTGIF